MSDIKCIGCGSLLQSYNPDEVGYVNEEVLKKNEEPYCLRCFRLKNYSYQSKSILSKDDYLRVVQKIAKTNSLVVSLVDIFDFSGSFISSIKRHTGQNDIILVGNKSDLLPKSVKPYKITRWMRHMANLEGFNVLDCVLVSAKSGDNIDSLMDSIDKYSKKRDCYIVGTCNVGKSTLVNTIIKKYSDVKKDIVTTSIIPGTTLDFIKIPYENNYIIDTPGLVNDSQIIHQLKTEDLKVVMPKVEIKSKNYQLNPLQTIFIGGLACIDFLSGDKTSFVCYFSNELYLHRTKTENKKRLWETKYNDLLVPVVNDEYNENDFARQEFNIPGNNKKYDVVISGLGFITISSACKVCVYANKGIGIYLREAII